MRVCWNLIDLEYEDDLFDEIELIPSLGIAVDYSEILPKKIVDWLEGLENKWSGNYFAEVKGIALRKDDKGFYYIIDIEP